MDVEQRGVCRHMVTYGTDHLDYGITPLGKTDQASLIQSDDDGSDVAVVYGLNGSVAMETTCRLLSRHGIRLTCRIHGVKHIPSCNVEPLDHRSHTEPVLRAIDQQQEHDDAEQRERQRCDQRA